MSEPIIVFIEYVGDGLFRATSPNPETQGLFIHGETADELKEVVPAAIKAMLDLPPRRPASAAEVE